jgi:WD40 repeat protein
VLKDKLSVQVLVKAADTLFIALQNGSIISYETVKRSWTTYFQHTELITAMLPLRNNAMLMGDWKGNILLYKNDQVTKYKSDLELKVKVILESRDYYLVVGYDDRFIFMDKSAHSIVHSFKYDHRITSSVLAIEDHLYFGDAEGNVVVYNTTGKDLERVKAAHDAEVTNLALHETANRIITTDALGYIKIWMQDLSGPVQEIAGHDKGVSLIKVIDGTCFISVSGSGSAMQRSDSDDGTDNTIKRWSIFTGHCEGVYAADELITAMCLDDTGRIISGLRNGRVHQFVSSGSIPGN